MTRSPAGRDGEPVAGAIGRGWLRLRYGVQAAVLIAVSVGWLVGVFVVHAHGWLWSWLLPVAFIPLVAVVGVLGAHARARRAARAAAPLVEVPHQPAGPAAVSLPLVGLLAFVTSRLAATLTTDGVPEVLGLFFAGIVWVVLVQLRHSAGAVRPWNLPPLLYGLAAATALGLGSLFALVPDQPNAAMLGALLGPMLAWFVVWLARWLPRRRARHVSGGHPGIGEMMGS